MEKHPLRWPDSKGKPAVRLPLIGLLPGLMLVLVLAGCGGQAEPTPAAVAAAGSGSASFAEARVESATPAPTATPSAVPTATPTPSPTATSTSTPTPEPTPTATATPMPELIQLTSGGCCTQPFWSPDSGEIRFIDRPGADGPTGIWSVPLASPLAEPALLTERIELSAAGPDYLVETTGDTTAIERLADGQRWTVPAGGRSVIISPDRTRIAWSVSNDNLPSESRVATVWVANLDGSEARQVATLPRGGVSAWIGGEALLVSGRQSLEAREQVLSALSLADGSITELARAERLRGQALSPGGRWIAYYVTFDADPSRNGLWLVRTDGSQQLPVDRTLFGAYQWRGCPDGCAPEQERLIIIPFDPGAAYHAVWELDPNTGETRLLVDPAVTPIKIANGDWRLSPDGRHLAFVESRDRNIWSVQLPD
jgi:hypothetical protein